MAAAAAATAAAAAAAARCWGLTKVPSWHKLLGLGFTLVQMKCASASMQVRGSLEQQQQHVTGDAAAAAGTFMTPSRWQQQQQQHLTANAAAAGGTFMTPSKWRQQQQQPGAGGSPRSLPGVNFSVCDSPLFK
jgi:hypothetical protein